MGFEIIDGYAGKAHITQEQVGDCNIGTYGPENYVLPTGRKLAYEIITNNKIRVYDGAFLIQGRRCHLRANTYVDFVVENGSQGEKRYDILAAKYVKDSVTKVENIECVTYKGTPSSGTPDDPVVDTGDIRAGESPIAFPLYRVTIDGINVTSVVPLFETLWRSSDIKGFLNAYDEIMACTKDGFVPTALGVKEGFEQLNTNLENVEIIANAAKTNAASALEKANAAMPKRGGTFTGTTTLYAGSKAHYTTEPSSGTGYIITSRNNPISFGWDSAKNRVNVYVDGTIVAYITKTT